MAADFLLCVSVHCLEDLVQEVICHADTAPYTTRWYQKDPRPTGNSDILHECVNWDMLKDEFKRKHVNPWEPGLLVHPVFGKSRYSEIRTIYQYH